MAEALEPRHLLSADTISSLVYSGIAPSPDSPTNSGLLIATDVASGFVAPLHAPFSSTSDRANGWHLAPYEGFTGLAFGPGALDLLGTASAAGRSASRLLTMDPYTGVQRTAPVHVRAGSQAIHVSDLGVIPGASFQLYGLGTPTAVPSASFQLYVIDPGSGQAVAISDQPVWLGSLDEADALALGPDGTIFVGGWESTVAENVLYVQQPDGTVHRHALPQNERIVGMDTRITYDASQAVNVELLASTADGQWRWLDPISGQSSAVSPPLAAPLRGMAGDVVFHPAPESLVLQEVHHADFETGTAGYTANNQIHAMPGMWHPSTGRYQDSLINHTHGQLLRPGYNWYYGQFETSTGGGTYLTTYRHAGILSSPTIEVPQCATTTLSFSYLLDVRPPLDVDFVEVWVEYVDSADQVQRTRLLSRAEGTLPETGNRWLTATADLSPYAGREVQIQFSFDTGGIPDVDPEGWYVDDVVIASFPRAICGFKWEDLNHDGQWDLDEPGKNGRTIYVDVNDNGQYDPAIPEQPFAGGLDANTFAAERRVLHPEGQVVLEVSATGEAIWAMPDPNQPSQKILARGTAAGEEIWMLGPMLRATFPTAAHTVSLDVAQASANGSTRVVLQAYDPHENRIAEQERTVTGTSWQTITIHVPDGDIAFVKASVDHGEARFNQLRYWGTTPAVAGDPAFVTRNNGQHDGAFWFDRLPPGEYTVREILPEGWKQSYPGAPDFSHTITVTAGEPVVGRWETTEAPNFGNFKPDISGYKWHDLDYSGYWDKDEHEGLKGWRIELYHDINGNGILDAGEPLVDWTTTQWDGQRHGAFWFAGLSPGDYILREVIPDRWEQTYPGGDDLEHAVTLLPGQQIVGRWQETEEPNFGNARPPMIAIEKLVSSDGGQTWEPASDLPGPDVYEGTQPHFQFVVTNTGLVDLENVTLTDSGVSEFEPLLPDVLPVDGSFTTFAVGVWQAGQQENVATASGSHRSRTAQDTDNAFYFGARPEITLVKQGTFQDENANGFANVGETIAYEFLVTNTGNVPLDGIELSDSLLGSIVFHSGDDNGNGLLDPDDVWRYTGVYTLTQQDIDAGYVENVAAVIGIAPNGHQVGDEDDHTEDLPWHLAISLEKVGTFSDENADGYADPGETIVYEFTVTNTANVTLRNVELIDARLGQTVSIDELAPGEVWKHTVNYVLTQQDIDGGTIENTATVTAQDPKGGLVTDEDQHILELPWNLTIELSKTGEFDPQGDGDAVPGKPIVYTFTVTNESNVTLGEVELSDSLVSPIFEGGDTNGNGLLDVGEVWTYTATYAVTQQDIDAGEVENVATVTANAPDGQHVSDKDDHIEPLPQRPEITLTKTGIWQDENGNEFADVGETIFYTFEVSNDGNVTLTNVRLFDPDIVSIVCPSDLPIATLAPGAVEVCTGIYSITQEDIAAGKKENTATAESDQTDPVTASATVLLPPPPIQPSTQTVQFITPISVYREEGQFQPQPIEPPSKPQWIEGYVWHDLNVSGKWENGELGREGWWVFLDLNDNGVWDPTEPFAVTDASGRFVFDVDPGTYHLRVDALNMGLSDGAFAVSKFPGSEGHVIELQAGQPVIGASGPTDTPTVPNFGIFVYSPFVRPADQHFAHATHPESRWGPDLRTALEPWQSFTVDNTTGADFEITEIQKNIDTSRIAVADQFVSVFLKQGETFIPILDVEPAANSSVIEVDPPIVVPSGEMVQFFAFYDPAIRDGDRVIEQYPDWFGENKHTHAAHTFTRGDHLSVITNTDATFRVDLVGGSTYDSDIFYDGAVDPNDFQYLQVLLTQRTIQEKLFIAQDDPLFDPTADSNSRCANEADGVHATCEWPLLGFPARELGLGDFGPMNVEWFRARAPFLDLDPGNRSGAKGADYLGEFRSEPVPIADADARFANSLERVLEELSFQITDTSLSQGDQLSIDESSLIPLGLMATGNGTPHLTLTSTDVERKISVEQYTHALHLVRFQSPSLAPRTVEIKVQAKGAAAQPDGPAAEIPFRFTRLVDDREVEGNIAVARIVVAGPSESNAAPNGDFDETAGGESESVVHLETASVSVHDVISDAVSDGGIEASSDDSVGRNLWQNPKNRYDVNDDNQVTPIDVLQIVNHLVADVSSTPLPTRTEGSAPYLDVNGDGHATALDALLIINHLSAEQRSLAEGEASRSLAKPVGVESTPEIPTGEPGSVVVLQPQFDDRMPSDHPGNPQVTNDKVESNAPADASESVPPVMPDHRRTPTATEMSFADDDSEDVNAANLDIEELLSDLVEEITTLGLA